LFLNSTRGYSKTVWVVDRKIKSFIPFSDAQIVIELDGGDESKSLNTWTWLINKFSEFQVDRNSYIVAIGGGSISDLVGYSASVYLRGIPYSIVPSTLLSLIDASLGGKNGINLNQQKNQVGTFYQPANIYCVPQLIKHLPTAEMADGFAEVIKYGLIIDRTLFDTLAATNLEKILSNSNVFQEIINSCIIHKSNIVEEDPFESGKRRILNFGHTIGHAIESVYGLSHGKSVSIGMCFAAKMSDEKSEETTSFLAQLVPVLKQFQLPTKLEKFSSDLVFEKIKADKKREDDFIHFVFLNKIGTALVEKISLNDLRTIMKKAEEEKWIS